jgi:hypothetical protein
MAEHGCTKGTRSQAKAAAQAARTAANKAAARQAQLLLQQQAEERHIQALCDYFDQRVEAQRQVAAAEIEAAFAAREERDNAIAARIEHAALKRQVRAAREQATPVQNEDVAFAAMMLLEKFREARR